MSQDNITLKVNLDTKEFEKAIQKLINVTETGFNSISKSIEQALNMQNIIKEIESVDTSISGTIKSWGDQIRSMGADIGGDPGQTISILGILFQMVGDIGIKFKEAKNNVENSAMAMANLTVELELNKKAHEENIDKIQNQTGANNILIDSIEKLYNNKKRSIDQETELINLVDMLSQRVPDLAISYDKHSQSLNMSTDAMRKFVEGSEKIQLAEEYQRQYLKAIEVLSAAEINLAEKNEILKKTTGENEKAISDAMFEQCKAINVVLELKKEIGNLSQTMTDNALAIDEYTETFKTVTDAYDTIAAKSQEIEESETKIAELKEERLKLMQAAYDDYVKHATDAFGKIPEAMEPKLDEMIANLKENQAATKEWADGLNRLAETDIDGNFLKVLENMGPAARGIINELLLNIEGDGVRLKDQAKEISDLYAQGASDALENVKERFNDETFEREVKNPFKYLTKEIEKEEDFIRVCKEEIATALQTIIDYTQNSDFLPEMGMTGDKAGDAILSNFDDTIEDKKNITLENMINLASDIIDVLKNKFEAGKEIGDNLIKGIINGIIENTGSAVQNIKDFAGSLIDSLKEKLKIQSPSKVMEEEIGQNIALGVAVGIEDNSDEAVEIGTESANEIIDRMGETIEERKVDIYNQSISLGESIVDGTIDGFNEKMPDLQDNIDSKMNIMLETFEQIGYQSSVPIGTNIAAGIQAGFEMMLPMIAASMQAGMASLTAATSGFLGIASPSKLFKDKIGKNIALGIGAGIDDEMPGIIDETERYMKLLASIPDPTNIKIELNPLDRRNRQMGSSIDAMLASSDRSNDMLSRIADYGMQQSMSTPNINVTLEPTADIRGFFDYISTGVKRANYLNGV